MAEKVFCSKCGKELEFGMQFCPACGQVIAGTDADKAFKKEQEEIEMVIKEGNVMWLTFFLAVYAIPAIIFGAFILADTAQLTSAIMADEGIIKWFLEHGIVLTPEMVSGYFTSIGSAELASGILVLASLFCVYKRKYWIFAVIFCFFGAIMCTWSVFGVFIGILVTIMIYTSKDIFEDAKKPATA